MKSFQKTFKEVVFIGRKKRWLTEREEQFAKDAEKDNLFIFSKEVKRLTEKQFHLFLKEALQAYYMKKGFQATYTGLSFNHFRKEFEV